MPPPALNAAAFAAFEEIAVAKSAALRRRVASDESKNRAATDAAKIAAATPAPLEFNFDDLDQLGPQFRSLVRAGREVVFQEQLAIYIRTQDSEIERLCNFHYQEFLQSVDQLLQVRLETVALKTCMSETSNSFHYAAGSLLSKKMLLIQTRKTLLNIEKTMDASSSCLSVMNLVLRVNRLFGYRKYYAALRCIQSIRAQLPAILHFQFALDLVEALPRMQATIRLEVSNELREWFVFLRENSRHVGRACILNVSQVTPPQTPAGRSSAASLQGEILTDDSNFNPFDNELVRLDFRPLYQAIHIFSSLSRLDELVVDFEEQRRLQAILFLNPNFSITGSEISALERFLFDVAGYFVIEKQIFCTTTGFRSRASVDLLWDTTASNIHNLIEATIATSTDPTLYLSIKTALTRFAQVLQANGYGSSLSKIMELLSTVFERYCDMMKTSCAEAFTIALDELDFDQVQVQNKEDLEKAHAVFGFTESAATLQKNTFPRKLPFSSLVLFCRERMEHFVSGFYEFAQEFYTQYTGSEVDDILKKSIDNVLIRYICQPLLSVAENCRELPKVLLIFVDMDHFARQCEEIEARLERLRLATTTGKTVLQATGEFRRSSKQLERRLFELLHVKINEQIDAQEYDFAISTAPTNKTPSGYLRDLVNFLTTVMFATLENLPVQVQSYMYFEIFDHVASRMVKIILSPTVKRLSVAFVERFVIDVGFLERYVFGLGDPNLGDTFLELHQIVALMQTDSPNDYLDSTGSSKLFGRIKAATALDIFEKLNNNAGVFASKAEKTRKKSYEAVIAALQTKLQKQRALSPPPSKNV